MIYNYIIVCQLQASNTYRLHNVKSLVILLVAPAAPPTNFSGSVVSSSRLALSWSPPPAHLRNGLISRYVVNVTELPTNIVLLFNATENLNSDLIGFIVPGLHPYYRYSISIAAFTVAEGPKSDAIILETLEDGKWYVFYIFVVAY